MYSMASWSPSQSDPFTVSYMCQRQSSSPMFPSEAETPPCAATVWLRVGNTLVMQAGSEEHTFALQSLLRISYADFCLTKYTQSIQMRTLWQSCLKCTHTT